MSRSAWARLRAWRPRPMVRAWLFTTNVAVARAQIDPFHQHREGLQQRYGLIFDEWDVGEAQSIAARPPPQAPQIVFLQDRSAERDQLSARIAALRSVSAGAKIVFLDCFASTYASHFWLLAEVDLYVKKSLFRDLTLYERRFRDGRIFADELIRHYGLEARFEGQAFAVTPHLGKLMLGWNLGTKQALVQPFEQNGYRPLGGTARDLDVTCRVSVRDQPQWYTLHRRAGLQRVENLSGRFRVVASQQRLPRREYWQEIGRSKITVSPFGWGEICLRDFEAVLHGSLLVKPSMAHLTTLPDIYREGETYAAVGWDLGDLEDVCTYYLQHDAERARIVANATAAYARFFTEQTFVQQIGEILTRLGLR